MSNEEPEQEQMGPPVQAPPVQAPAGQKPAVQTGNGSGDNDAVALENALGSVEKTRARMGFLAVAVSDIAIALAAILTVFWIHQTKSTSSSIDPVVSILTSAFTAIGTLTTA